MKIVIEIDNEHYERIMRLEEGVTVYPTTLALYEAVKNGTPFEAHPTGKCKGCYYNDGETHAECVVCDKEAQPTKMRDATEEERKSVKDYIESISKSTGLHFYESQSTDAVSREEALLALTGMDLPTDRDKLIALFTERIQHLPPATPQRPKGEWIEIFIETPNDPYSYGFKSHKCSKCEYSPLQISNYCPNCGAEMNGGEEDADSD